MRTLLRLVPVVLALSATSTTHALSPVACTMDAKLCPDGVTYVGRDGGNNCEWQKCPGETDAVNHACDPYMCADGTQIDRCDAQGNVLQYFAAPCHMHGGEGLPSFSDVSSDHANADAIAYVKSEGIVEGYADGTYKPEAFINRAEFVKILMGAFEDDGRMCKIAAFSDVDQYAWYATYAHKARCQGIVEGYPDGTFKPAASINFVEAAKILVKAFHLEASATVPECSGIECTWYWPYAHMMEAHAAIPISIKRFGQNITRGEMAEMIYRLKAGNKNMPTQTFSYLDRRELCDRLREQGMGCE